MALMAEQPNVASKEDIMERARLALNIGGVQKVLVELTKAANPELVADYLSLHAELRALSARGIRPTEALKNNIEQALTRLAGVSDEILGAAESTRDDWNNMLAAAHNAFDIPPAINSEVSERLFGTLAEQAALAAWAKETRAKLTAQRLSGVQAPEDDEPKIPETPVGPAAVTAVASAESRAEKLERSPP